MGLRKVRLSIFRALATQAILQHDQSDFFFGTFPLGGLSRS